MNFMNEAKNMFIVKSKRDEKIMQWMKDKILLLFDIVSKSQYFKLKKSLTS